MQLARRLSEANLHFGRPIEAMKLEGHRWIRIALNFFHDHTRQALQVSMNTFASA